MKKIILILCLAVAGITNANAQTVIVMRPVRRVVVTPAHTVIVRPVRRVVVARPVVVTRRRVVVVHH
ncbi:hypothetical protein ACRQ5D_08515 [Mucilaginibacter sp. P25]|uniref:Uncharacterized protein n=1 Tax=Mucilaginibacter gossypii TaxID=551996 RepID=A0A1G8KDW4_9SPHI|nr:hypothetical protein [Mucilaginibacter gossypii]SDI41622.1 hypothetical protein SAMN05192573_12081 [Mucilaginibacter gossypii]